MTIQHISYPSTDQFRNVIKYVRDNAKFHNEPVPTIAFTGTVKLHGTNHAVCLSPNGEMYTQSRERITTPESDNAGSSAWTHANKSLFDALFAKAKQVLFPWWFDKSTIQIFGEWCGGNIQKGVGLNYLEKQFIVFGIRVSIDSSSQCFANGEEVEGICYGITKCIYDFPSYKLDIDFNKPELVQDELIKITETVEKDCPVARAMLGADFDKELIGEGVVWSAIYKGATIRFKVKGDKHSSSKVKVLAPVGVEKVNSVNEFVDKVLTESRLNQGLEHVSARTPENTGPYLKWVMGDVIKEEQDTLTASGLTTKDVTSTLSRVARQWFLLGA
jgi:hypothetical protein